MSDSIQLSNLISSMSSLNGVGLSSNCSCNSGSSVGSIGGAFDTVLISLLNAMSEKNKTSASINENISLNNIIDKYTSIINNTSNIEGVNNYANIDISNISKDERIENAVTIYSKKYGVDPNLTKAIIKVESDFNPNVESSAGAKGLMQLMPENCIAFGVTDPFNIEQNIEGGVQHIKEYIDRYNGDFEMALMAYNGGPTRMMNRGVRSIADIYKMPKETQNYVPKVMTYYKKLQGIE